MAWDCMRVCIYVCKASCMLQRYGNGYSTQRWEKHFRARVVGWLDILQMQRFITRDSGLREVVWYGNVGFG